MEHRAGNYNIYEHGVSVKYLSAFQHCRQEAQLLGEGWRKRIPNFPASYGGFSHLILEQVYKDLRAGKLKKAPDEKLVLQYTKTAEEIWRKERGKRAGAEVLEQIELSMAMLESVLPGYFAYWWEDFSDLKILKVEDSFEVPWKLSDGKFTHLFGYWDLVFGYTDKKAWVLDTKNKGRISPEILHDTLPRDLQMNLYMYAVYKIRGKLPGGAWYNIIRRPGQHRKKNESLPDFAARIKEDVQKRPEFYFMRIEIPWVKSDMLEFEKRLTALVEDFYQWWLGKAPHYASMACETSWGVCDFNQKCAGNDYPYEKKARPPVKGSAVELIA